MLHLLYILQRGKIPSYFKAVNWKEIWDRRSLEKCIKKAEGSKRRESWNFHCPLSLAILADLFRAIFYWLGFMHVHRILFVILGNLLKPPTHPSHLLGNTAAPPMPWVTATSDSAAAQPCCAAWHQQTSFKSGKGCQKQPATFLVQVWPWEQPGKEKKNQKTTTPAFVVVCAPSTEGKNTLPGRDSRCSLLFADTEVCRSFSCLLLTPCPKDIKTVC